MTAFLKRHSGSIALVVFAAIYYRWFGRGLDGAALYSGAGRCLWQGQPLLPCAPAFPYQPALAALFVPLIGLPPALQKLVWYLISLGSLLITVRLSEAMAERLYPGATQGKNLIWLRAITLVVCIKFILMVLSYAAYEAPALALMTAGIWALTAARDGWSGFALGLAAALRATPLIYLPYLAVKRRALACLVFLAAFVALSFLPDAIGALRGGHAGYFADWARSVAGPAFVPGNTSDTAFWSAWTGSHVENQSLRGLINRFATGPVFGLSPKILLLAVDGIVAAAAGALILLSPRNRKYAAIDGAVLLIAQLALSPMTSRYHFIFILPGVILVAAAIICDPRIRRWCGTVLAASFVLLVGTSNDLVGARLTAFTYRYGLWIEGAVLLLAAFAAMLWYRPAEAADERSLADQNGGLRSAVAR